MTQRLAAAACLAALIALPARGAPELVGVGELPGTATDRSDPDAYTPKVLEDGSPHNRFGATGSSIAYTGDRDRYIMPADRGPADGTTRYADRFSVVELTLTPGTPGKIVPRIASTTLLTDESGRPFTGFGRGFDATNSPASPRFDPEGARVAPDGTIYLSDEYGPFLYQFDRAGRRLRSLRVPEAFLIAHPHPDEKAEIQGNTRGRVTNKGMEGLALTPDGTKLLGALQSPLIQDHGREGLNIRLLQVDPATGATREFVYPLADRTHGLSEILAVNDHEFLVLEREGKGGTEAGFKRITRIDTAAATDVSGVPSLPAGALPAGIRPVARADFLDLLDPRFGLAGPSFPEKVEGLAFGPDLPDGRHLLMVTTDNDFKADQPTRFWAFALAPGDLPGYEPARYRPAAAAPAGN